MSIRFSGFYVFGDSLVDPGNALKAANFLDDLPFTSSPDRAPTADKGYFQGRFSDGYNFADLLSNKLLGLATKPTFPYGFEDPLLGIPITLGGLTSGSNLSFAYGGAQALQGDEIVPDLDAQTDAYKDGRSSDPNALYLVTIGGNDVRDMVPRSGDVVAGDAALAKLTAAADKIALEVSQLYGDGVRHVLVAGIPDVGLLPYYTGSSDEALRRQLGTEYSVKLDALLTSALGKLSLPAGADLRTFSIRGFGEQLLANPSAFKLTNLTEARTVVQAGSLAAVGSGFLFFDDVHPSAQVHALAAAEMLSTLGYEPSVSVAAPAVVSDASGSLAAAGATSTFTASLVGGRTYTLDLMGVSSGSGSLSDPILRVLSGAGTTVFNDDDSGLGLDAHLQFVAPSTGAFTVQVAGVGVTAGSYRLQAVDGSGANLLLTGQLRGSNVSILGSPANDTITAEAGANVLRGAAGADVIRGGSGPDELNGNAGEDTVRGGDGPDTVYGGQGQDRLYGEGGADIVLGNLGRDTCDGGVGNDTIYGGGDNDVLIGGAGDDYLSGDLGSDTLTGNGGADRFHASADGGLDRITDFRISEGDRLLLDTGTAYSVHQVGSDTVVDLSGGGQAVLVGVKLTSLPEGWVVFA